MTSATATTTRGADGGEEEEQLEEYEEEERFFESLDRVPSSVSINLDLPSSDSEADVDARISFASAVGPPPQLLRLSPSSSSSSSIDESADDHLYGIWMAEPGSIEERRRRLLKGMGLASSRRTACADSPKGHQPAVAVSSAVGANNAASSSASPRPSPSVLVRSRSDGGEAAATAARIQRGEQLLGTSLLSGSLVRTLSAPASSSPPRSAYLRSASEQESNARHRRSTSSAYRTIRNLDTGKEFVLLDDGTWKSLSDLQTGMKLSMEEFERSVGYSPIIKELLRRENVGTTSGTGVDHPHPTSPVAGLTEKFSSKKKGAGWLKNIRGVANSVTGLRLEKEREAGRSPSSSSSSSSSEWVKVRQHGKSYKELSGMYMCQEIQAHQGSIWSIKFSADARYLASAGEDRVIRVWQVNECGTMSSFRQTSEVGNSAHHWVADNESPDGPLLDNRPSRKIRRGKASSSRRKSSVPDHIVVPATIFTISEKPLCSFEGHLDDVLDLSWSKSQYLLSSSMDKTVRLWDMESKACLKLFAHNDYVTCIQFNPVDDRYFISGSLDAKVRIWSIPDRQVIDWSDLHEMVTAACYTPDGQGALVGSHKGTCRFYSTSGGKLHQNAQIDIQNKRKKSHAKKITGFEFVPGNPSEVLITSADSQIRVYDGVQPVHKFRGFRNTNSQISASFTSDGNYVICASEDSHVYIWKREAFHHAGSGGKGKSWTTTRSHEHFQCRDVSVAIPWPGSSGKYELPSISCSWSNRYANQHCLKSRDSMQAAASMVCSPDIFLSCRSHCPRLPKKIVPDTQTLPCSEEELCNPSRSESGISNSSSSSVSTSWLRPSALSSVLPFGASYSSLSSSRWCAGSNRIGNIPATTAWGMVIVTAGLGGEIKVHQNFGLPLRINRQPNLF